MAYNAEIAIAFKAGLHIPIEAQDALNIFDHKREHVLGTYYHAEYIPWNDFVYNPIRNFIDKLNEMDMTELYAFVEVGDNDTVDTSGNLEYFQLNWHTDIDSPFINWDKGEEENLLSLSNSPRLMDVTIGEGLDQIMKKVYWFIALDKTFKQKLIAEIWNEAKGPLTVGECIEAYDHYESMLAHSKIAESIIPDNPF